MGCCLAAAAPHRWSWTRRGGRTAPRATSTTTCRCGGAEGGAWRFTMGNLDEGLCAHKNRELIHASMDACMCADMIVVTTSSFLHCARPRKPAAHCFPPRFACRSKAWSATPSRARWCGWRPAHKAAATAAALSSAAAAARARQWAGGPPALSSVLGRLPPEPSCGLGVGPQVLLFLVAGGAAG